jgi:hypothetical protein
LCRKIGFKNFLANENPGWFDAIRLPYAPTHVAVLATFSTRTCTVFRVGTFLGFSKIYNIFSTVD